MSLHPIPPNLWPGPGFSRGAGATTTQPNATATDRRPQDRATRPLSRRERSELALSRQLESVLHVASEFSEVLADGEDVTPAIYERGLALSVQLFAGSFRPEGKA